MKDKHSVIIMFIVSVAVFATVGLYLIASNFDFGSLSTSLIVIVIAVFATYIAVTRAKSVRRGLPAGDELTKRLSHKAGYYTFLCTIYLALGVSFFSDDFEIIGRHVGYIIILGSAIMFFVFYFWFNWRGIHE